MNSKYPNEVQILVLHVKVSLSIRIVILVLLNTAGGKKILKNLFTIKLNTFLQSSDNLS